MLMETQQLYWSIRTHTEYTNSAPSGLTNICLVFSGNLLCRYWPGSTSQGDMAVYAESVCTCLGSWVQWCGRWSSFLFWESPSLSESNCGCSRCARHWPDTHRHHLPAHSLSGPQIIHTHKLTTTVCFYCESVFPESTVIMCADVSTCSAVSVDEEPCVLIWFNHCTAWTHWSSDDWTRAGRHIHSPPENASILNLTNTHTYVNADYVTFVVVHKISVYATLFRLLGQIKCDPGPLTQGDKKGKTFLI